MISLIWNPDSKFVLNALQFAIFYFLSTRSCKARSVDAGPLPVVIW